MFKFLQRLMGSKTEPVAVVEAVNLDSGVELRSLEGNRIILRATALFALSQSLEVSITVAHPDGSSKRRRADITFHESRKLFNQTREYVGDLEDVSPEMRDALLDAIDRHRAERREARGTTVDQRADDRARLSFAVMSREFKNFKAVSGDVSPTGVKIFLENELDVGQVVDMVLNLDDDNFGSLKVRGEVMWCRPTENKFAAGLRFLNLSEEQAEALVQYIEYTEQYRRRVLRRPPG